MNIQEFKCNGIGNTQAANNVKPTIQTAVSVLRLRKSNDEIIASFPVNDDYYVGSRFSNDEAVATRVCSGLVNYAEKQLYNKTTNEYASPLIVEGFITSLIDSLSGTEMDAIILEGMRDCASADHWYKFEKQWD